MKRQRLQRARAASYRRPGQLFYRSQGVNRVPAAKNRIKVSRIQVMEARRTWPARAVVDFAIKNSAQRMNMNVL